MTDRKPTLCLDFDGVIHSYTSGWRGARTIPDPPVPGALEFVVTARERFRISIFSSRSGAIGGRRAMKRWLRYHLIELAGIVPEDAPLWWCNVISQSAFADPWPDEARFVAGRIVRDIDWPKRKPPALVTLDDRAITFTGEWPDLEELLAFKPWNKR